MVSSVQINDRTLCDLELLLDGSFSPLKGFMSEEDYYGVVDNMRLASGEIWPLPINLKVTQDSEIKIGDTIILKDQTNYPIAEMVVTSRYIPDLDRECQGAYGTTDTNHPYVAIIKSQKNPLYLGGPVKKINTPRHFDFTDIRKTPTETKEYFKKHGWKNIIGFQTRNPMHRSHFELTKYAIQQAWESDPSLDPAQGDDVKLFLNPVVGITQAVDINYYTRVKCYQEIIKKYPEGTAMLNLLNLSMRMAGPREAVFHAIVRKNYGCTHFVVGRDHAGPSYKTKDGKSFYGPYDAQELLMGNAQEIGIKVLTSKLIVYNSTCQEYMPIDQVPQGEKVLQISGTEQRRLLRAHEPIPDWFSFPEIVDILQRECNSQSQGICVYLVGLSGSGKSTIAGCLEQKIYEKDYRKVTILDGDVVRNHLSKGLGFSQEDRSTNVQRIGYVASEIVKHGGIVVCANIAPYDSDRLINRELVESTGGKYIEVFVNTSLEECERRDVKGLYALARSGKIKNFTGISDPFETPIKSDLEVSEQTGLENIVNKIIDLMYT